jgi:hypothetical protein
MIGLDYEDIKRIHAFAKCFLQPWATVADPLSDYLDQTDNAESPEGMYALLTRIYAKMEESDNVDHSGLRGFKVHRQLDDYIVSAYVYRSKNKALEVEVNSRGDIRVAMNDLLEGTKTPIPKGIAIALKSKFKEGHPYWAQRFNEEVEISKKETSLFNYALISLSVPEEKLNELRTLYSDMTGWAIDGGIKETYADYF